MQWYNVSVFVVVVVFALVCVPSTAALVVVAAVGKITMFEFFIIARHDFKCNLFINDNLN